ncbi:MAG: right-handed parallel beta-helix repeat-containing protein [Victivallales bacterium]|nr:right-handed parallel beta-helix repeat-containing protein [Victivallales bacterium]
MRWFCVILVFACMVCIGADEKPLYREPLKYYVSPFGSDENPGGKEMPFASFHRAQLQVRTILNAGALPPGGVTIVLKEGTYALKSPLVFTERDSIRDFSRTSDGLVTTVKWTSEGDVKLIGGEEIPLTAFSAVEDKEILNRLPEVARPFVQQVDLKAFGLKDFETMDDVTHGAAPFGEVFFRGRPMTLARWPNNGWATTAAIVDRGGKTGDTVAKNGIFEYDPQNVPAERWNVEKGIWLQGFWSLDWYDEIIRVKAVDIEKKKVELCSAQSRYGLGAVQQADAGRRRFRVLNCLEELDSEGEWFVDAATGILYCWLPPLQKDELETGSVIYSRMREPLVQLNGCKYLHISGMNIGYTLGGGVLVRGDDNILSNCCVENTGDFGIDVEGKTNCVMNCVVGKTGTYGISLNGGDLKTLEHGGNQIVNCLIEETNRWQMVDSAAVMLKGVHNVLKQCELRDLPHTAVMYSGNEHEISLNDIHHACLETDFAVLYTTRDWGSWRNIVRCNYIHHHGRLGSMGVCLDECDSGDTIDGNIFVRVSNAVHIGGGRHNIVKNNIFIDCLAALSMNAQGRENVKWNTGGADEWDLEAKLKAVNYRQPPWSERYPQLAKIMDDQPEWPLHNEFCRNVVVGGEGIWMKDESLRPLLKAEDNWFTNEDPAPDNIDWSRIELLSRTLPTILVRISSFEVIPFWQIGRKTDFGK